MLIDDTCSQKCKCGRETLRCVTDPHTAALKAPSPDAVKHVSVLEYPKQLVVRRDLVKVGALFIGKEQVGFPNGVQHGGVEVQRVIWILLIRQSRVVPLLPQKYVEPVVLRTRATFL